MTPTAFVGGGQLGYNAQFGQFVVGLGDPTCSGRTSEADRYGPSAACRSAPRPIVDYFGTVRARAGVAFDRTLVFATGGFAYGGSDVVVPGFGSDDNTHFGWTVGAGAEYAITKNPTTSHLQRASTSTPTSTAETPCASQASPRSRPAPSSRPSVRA